MKMYPKKRVHGVHRVHRVHDVQSHNILDEIFENVRQNGAHGAHNSNWRTKWRTKSQYLRRERNSTSLEKLVGFLGEISILVT